jgi:predicted nucleic acid-binding protein
VTLVVADASPLHYLILIEQQDLLARLYTAVVIPPQVAEELSRPSTPVSVRAWIRSPPAWLTVDARLLGERIRNLDPGEADAIALALQLGADVLLIDEQRGRAEARRLGLRPLGVVGVLEQAAQRDLVELESAVNRLVSTTNFRIAGRVIDEILIRDRQRRSRDPGLAP